MLQAALVAEVGRTCMMEMVERQGRPETSTKSFMPEGDSSCVCTAAASSAEFTAVFMVAE